jgi:drug/metabolite transporter (DMT)-like permease
MRDSHSLKRPTQGYLLALLAALCWATGGLTAKWLFTDASLATSGWPLPPLGIAIEPTVLSGARALSAFVVLTAWLLVRRRELFRVKASELPFLAAFGVIGLAGVHFSYFMTISLTNVATAILLEYLAPVLVLIVSVAFLGHRFTWALPAGVALSILGCALVVGAIGGEGLVVSPAGVAWGLASAVFFAFYSLMGSVAATRFEPYTVLVYGLGFASVFWLAWLGPQAVLGVFSDGRTAAAVLFMAVVSTVVPFAAFLTALRHIPPTNATVTSTVEPLLAGIGAFALFGESLSLVQLLGGALVVAAIVVVQMPEPAVVPVLPPPD